ncbi:hypothetical protein MPH_02960, partial [Macrophomina phaseolina MS6]
IYTYYSFSRLFFLY